MAILIHKGIYNVLIELLWHVDKSFEAMSQMWIYRQTKALLQRSFMKKHGRNQCEIEFGQINENELHTRAPFYILLSIKAYQEFFSYVSDYTSSAMTLSFHFLCGTKREIKSK